MIAPFKRILFGLLLLTVGSGCTLTPRGLTRDVAGAAPPAAINSTLRALNEQDNQRLMVELLASPQMHEATRAFASEIADGTMASLTEPERVARIEAMTTEYVTSLTRTMTRSMAAGLRRDLAPAIAEVMRESVASTMREMMSERYQHDMERMAGGLTRASVEAATQGMAAGLTRDLGPALRTALFNEQNAQSLRLTGRELAREVVLGSNDALAQIEAQKDRGGHPSLLTRLSSISNSGATAMKFVAIGVGAVALLLALWVVRLILKGRRIQAESERNAASAVMFAEAIRAAEGKPWSKELTDLIQERLRGDAVTGMIDEVLKPKGPARNANPRPTRPSLTPAHGGGT